MLRWWGGVGGVLTSWRPRPWYYVDNTCRGNLEDALHATLMTWGGVGWGGGCVLTSWRPRPWYYVDHTCRGNLEDALDATLMTWGGVGGVLTSWRPRPWYYECQSWKTLLMLRWWRGVGWGGGRINVLTTTSLILRMSKLEHGRQRKPQATLGGEVRGPHA